MRCLREESLPIQKTAICMVLPQTDCATGVLLVACELVYRG